MRFMVMHKVDADMEANIPPSQTIIASMGQLVQESLKAGVFENGAGLHRSAQRVRLEFSGGSSTVVQGPLTGRNELISAFFMIKVPAMQQAIAQAERFAQVLGDVEIEIGPVVEPWDLGLIPKPAEIHAGRFLLLVKGDARSERGERLRATVAQLEAQMREEGVLLAAEALAPSSRGSRLAAAPQASRSFVDGPFAESKELIAGFSIINVPNKKAALAWATRYAAILAGNEVDVFEVADPASTPA
jgi:hypothetical protein